MKRRMPVLSLFHIEKTHKKQVQNATEHEERYSACPSNDG